MADHYEVLGVRRSATTAEVRSAFQRLANRYDPHKRKPHPQADSLLKLVTEAYDVLTDQNRRAAYDQAALRSPSTASPHGLDGSGGRGTRRKASEEPQKKEPAVATKRIKMTSGGSGTQEASGAPRTKGPAAEHPLPCSLADLHNGVTKRYKITRTVLEATGQEMTADEILTNDVKPGWKKGTRITLPGKGNVKPNATSDLVMTIQELPHPKFKRDGDDLIYTHEISLLEALTGREGAQLTTLDGRSLAIPVTDSVVDPYCEEVMPGEGMPIAGEPSKKGDLRIKFDIMFPTNLTDEQKAEIKALLS